MSFNDFEAGFVKRNRILWISLVVSIVISSITLFIVATRKKYFVVSNGEIFKERLLAEDVCLESFIGMVKGSPNTNLISDGIINIIKKDPFELPVDSVLKVQSIESLKCRLILKSGGRLRSFVVSLVENKNYPFYYKLNQVDEVEIQEFNEEL